MKRILLTHLAYNLTALNNNVPSLVLEATNKTGSFDKFETTLYGPDGFDTPDYEVIIVEVPAHVAPLLSTLQAKAAYLITKVGEVVGEDLPYSVEIVQDPTTREYGLAITPPGAVQYAIDQEVPEQGADGMVERHYYPTFGQALNAAQALKEREAFNWIEISSYQADGNTAGDGYVFYDAVLVP